MKWLHWAVTGALTRATAGALLSASAAIGSAQAAGPATTPASAPASDAPTPATSSPASAQGAETSRTDSAALAAAEHALESNDLQHARDLLTRLAADRPNDTQVLYDLGYAEEGLGDAPGAQTAYAAAITADPGNGEAHVALGLLLARAGGSDQAGAQAQLRAGADNAATPAEVRARALRALSVLEAKQPDQAQADLLAAIRLTRETPADLSEAAAMAAAAGNLPAAEAAYRRALAAEPGSVASATGMAAVLQREGKLAEADELLQGALPAHPDDERILSQLAALKLAEGKPNEAITLLAPLAAGTPAIHEPGAAHAAGSGGAARTAPPAGNPLLARELAHLYVSTGQYAEAEPLYRTLLQGGVASPELLDEFGTVLVRQAKFAEAESVLRRAVADQAAFPEPAAWAEAESHLAFAASRNHDPRGALQALTARATVLPISAASLFLEATAHDSLHEYKEAVRGYRAFLAAADGKFPDEEFEARHRLVALEHTK